MVINLTAGALRFITGKADHHAYEIVTPTATIGVRGTVFDVYTKPDGEMAVAMIDGAIEVCPKVGLCRVHNVVGKFLHMTSARRIFAARQVGRIVPRRRAVQASHCPSWATKKFGAGAPRQDNIDRKVRHRRRNDLGKAIKTR